MGSITSGRDSMSEYKEDQNLPEAAASATCKVKSPAGFSYLFTMRSEQVKTLMLKLLDMEVWFKKAGWVPQENGYGQPKVDNKAKQEACLHPEDQVKLIQVKKEGPNTGKWFKSCRNCDKFLGFVKV